jgi:hypothetical protein
MFSEVNSLIVRIDHIQIAAPKSCEFAAREFYGSILGLAEIEKPASLGGRGGCWFQCGDQQLHIGVESAFRPAKKAHPAFAVARLDKLRESLITHAVKTRTTTPSPARVASSPKIPGATDSNSSNRRSDSLDDRRIHS